MSSTAFRSIPPTKWSELPASLKKRVYVTYHGDSSTYDYPVGILKEFRIFAEDLVPEDLASNTPEFPIQVPFSKKKMDLLYQVVTEPSILDAKQEFSEYYMRQLQRMCGIETRYSVPQQRMTSSTSESESENSYLHLLTTRSGYRFLSEDVAYEWVWRCKMMVGSWNEFVKVNKTPGKSPDFFWNADTLQVDCTHLTGSRKIEDDYRSWWYKTNRACCGFGTKPYPYELEYLTRTGEVRTLAAEKIVDTERTCCCVACCEKCLVEPVTFVGPTAMDQLAKSYSGDPRYLRLPRSMAVVLWDLYHKTTTSSVGSEKPTERLSEELPTETSDEAK